MNKTAGIFCDDYKVDKFKEYLNRVGFAYTVEKSKIMPNTTVIKVSYNSKDYVTLANLIRNVNRSFKK